MMRKRHKMHAKQPPIVGGGKKQNEKSVGNVTKPGAWSRIADRPAMIGEIEVMIAVAVAGDAKKEDLGIVMTVTEEKRASGRCQTGIMIVAVVAVAGASERSRKDAVAVVVAVAVVDMVAVVVRPAGERIPQLARTVAVVVAVAGLVAVALPLVAMTVAGAAAVDDSRARDRGRDRRASSVEWCTKEASGGFIVCFRRCSTCGWCNIHMA